MASTYTGMRASPVPCFDLAKPRTSGARSSCSTGSPSASSMSSRSSSPCPETWSFNRHEFEDGLRRRLAESLQVAPPPGLELPEDIEEEVDLTDDDEIDLTEEEEPAPTTAKPQLSHAEIKRRLSEIENAMGDKALLLHPSAVNRAMLDSLRQAHSRLLEQLAECEA